MNLLALAADYADRSQTSEEDLKRLPDTAVDRFGGLHIALKLYIEMFQYSAPPGTPVRPRMCDHGITHLCFYSGDVFADYERLTALGMSFNCPPGGSASTRATYGRDCDGTVVELLQIVDAESRFGFERATVAAS